MKKILVLLCLASSILIFNVIYESYKEKTISDIHGFFGQKEGNKSLLFDGNLQGFRMGDFLDVLYDFSSNEDITFNQFMDDPENNEYIYYLLSSQSIESLFEFKGISESVDSTNLDFHASTECNNRNSKISLINRAVTLDIYSLSQIDDPYSIFISIDASSDTIMRLQQVLNERFGEFEPLILEMSSDYHDNDLFIRNNSIQVMSVSVILLLIVVLFYLSSSLKEISVLKLQGYSGYMIFREMLLPTYIWMCVISFLVSILFFVINVRIGSYDWLSMATNILLYNVLLLFLVSIGFGLFIIAVRTIPLSSLLKGRNLDRSFAITTFVIKIMTLVVMLPIINQQSEILKSSLQSINYYSNYRHEFENTVVFTGYNQRYRNLEMYPTQISSEIEDPLLLRLSKLVDDLSDEGAIYLSSQEYNMTEIFVKNKEKTIQTIDVNENYIWKYIDSEEIKDYVSKNLMTHEVVILTDEETAESVYIDPTILVSDRLNYTIKSFQFGKENYTYHQTNPKIIVVYGNDTPRFNKTVFSNLYLTDIPEKTIETVIKDHGFKGYFVQRELSYEPISSISINRTLSIKALTILIPRTILLILVSFCFYITYKKSVRQTVAVKTLHGYSWFGMHKIYMVISLVTVALFSIIYSSSTSFLLLVITEILVLVKMWYDSKKYQLKSQLKKEDI